MLLARRIFEHGAFKYKLDNISDSLKSRKKKVCDICYIVILFYNTKKKPKKKKEKPKAQREGVYVQNTKGAVFRCDTKGFFSIMKVCYSVNE